MIIQFDKPVIQQSAEKADEEIMEIDLEKL